MTSGEVNPGVSTQSSRESTLGFSKIKLPELPGFRDSSKKWNITDARVFIAKFETILEANEIPEIRWCKALITCLTYEDSEFARQEYKNMPWEEIKSKFTHTFSPRKQREHDLKEYLSIKQEKKEKLCTYCYRFRVQAAKLKKEDDYEESIILFRESLLPQYQRKLEDAAAHRMDMLSHMGADTVANQSLKTATSEKRYKKSPKIQFTFFELESWGFF